MSNTLKHILSQDVQVSAKGATMIELADENGLPYGVRNVDNKPRVSAMPYTYDIAEGNVADHTPFRALGSNASVGATEEDLWEKGGVYAFPADGGVQLEVISTGANAADDDGSPAGTGIRTVEIHYLDTAWAEQTETLTMNGVGAVTTTATDILRVNDFHAATVGSGGSCAGATGIDLQVAGAGAIHSHIANGKNTSLQAIWTVPAGKTVYLTDWHFGAASTTASRWARFVLQATAQDGVYTKDLFRTCDIGVVLEGSDKLHFTHPIPLGEKTDIKISVIGSGAGIVCTGAFEGWYETT